MADAAFCVDNGLAIVTNRIIGAGTEPKYIGWGIGTTGAAATDTGLETASAEDRTSGTGSRQQTSTANDTHQVAGSITCVSTGKAIAEVAIFDADTAGNCYFHGTFSVINVSVGDSISFTLKVVFNQAA